MDDDFELWLGHIGKEGSFRNDILRAVNQAGGFRRTSGTGKRRFVGSRIGRAAAVGRMLASGDGFGASRSRRVIVKARYVKLAGKGAKAAAAHLRYLQRDGTTREGERGTLYGPENDVADGKAFLERGTGDRHQFRFIVSPEDGQHYEDLKPLTRRLMQQVEKDLDTRLEWVAVDHYNTDHPHTHIVVRGIDDRGKDLIIARDYISSGIAARASQIVSLDLGPRTELEIQQARRSEITAERFTRIDRTLLTSLDEQGLALAWHRDPVEQGLRAARLGTLARMGLAVEEEKGRYRLDPDLEQSLRAMGKRGDIIATMHERLKARPELASHDYAIFEPGKDRGIVGRVEARGLSDEHHDRHYMIVEATDGRTHYVDLGHDLADGAMQGRMVRVEQTAYGIRTADRNVAEIAAANGGVYSVAKHLAHDRTATHKFAEAHVRRLEAIRRAQGGVERHLDGTWTIPNDHLKRAEDYELRKAQSRPVTVEILAERPLEQLVRHDGPTWLDRQCVAQEPEQLQGRMGGEVRGVLQQRRQWLIEQGLAEQEGNTVRFRANLLASLQQRELRRVAGQLSQELGIPFVENRSAHIEGTYRRAVQIGGQKYAVIEKSREFTLAPWRPELEKRLNQQVSGLMRDAGITWRRGIERGGPEIS
ncbi:relaxase/mobilization nuclease RlxS [Novosphingobium sp. BL-8A]|uniref:relaxase/mobilization nuclease RlxS n=1 Tax=Novosphingobium sp. BL-8A TaxID=3127639 RepID=UPI00375789D1